MHICDTCNMTPGSATARSLGCTCPVYDNAHGHNTGRLVVLEGCPVHDTTRKETQP